MIRWAYLLAAAFATTVAIEAASPTEQLHYNITWPSGLGLGEASLSFNTTPATQGKPARIAGELTIDASIPGFQVADRYTSRATTDFCSLRFDKKLRHGPRQSDEVLDFDQQHMTVSRQTLTPGHEPAPQGVDLGKSEMNAPACAKDALTYLAFLQNELVQGRLPTPQPVFFGAAYDVRVDFRGTEIIKVGDSSMDADRVNISLHGPASDLTFTAFFAHDASRTPVLFQVPLAMGTFSMELAKP